MSMISHFVLHESRIAVIVLNWDRCITMVNKGFLRLFDLDDLEGTPPLASFLDLRALDVTGWPASGATCVERLVFKGHKSGLHVMQCHVYGTDEGFILFGENAVATNDEVLNTVSSLNNEMANLVREIHLKNRSLRHANMRITDLMHTDALTGISNRRCLMDQFETEIEIAHQKDLPLSLVMADLDFFKQVNDNHGHDIGDEVLKAFALLLSESIRKGDLVARYGGEEFVAVLKNAELNGAEMFAERVRSEWAGTSVAGLETCFSASFGVAQLRPGEDLLQIFKRADLALYEAKAKGRNRVELAVGG
ncbi:MAG: GGDEF domain-containing protein [Desulfuromonadales bacterium]